MGLPGGEKQASSFLIGNLGMLRDQGAPVLSWLEREAPSLDAWEHHLMVNRRGEVDWRLPSGGALMEGLPPEVAYRGWVPGEGRETSATVIVGCNLGKGLNRLLSRTPRTHKVMVLEPRPQMLIACLALSDYRPYLSQRRLTFLPPARECLEGMFSELTLHCVFGRIILRSDLPSRQLGPEYALWTQSCRDALEDLRLELHTVRLRQDEMVGHELANLPRALTEGSLLGMKDRGKGVGAVVLGAGPSLGRFAPLLAGQPGTALYAAPFQALPALKELGLTPHFCMAVECNELLGKVYRDLDREWATTIPMVYSATVHPEVVQGYPGPTVSLWTLGGLGPGLFGGKELTLDVGGNVGLALVRFLTWCGVDRILLVGQDFAWSGERTHVEGHLTADNPFQYDPRSHVILKDREGGTIYSAPPYTAALRALSMDLMRSGIPVYDLYGGGAVIEGSTPVTWEDVIEQGLLRSGPWALGHFLAGFRENRSPVRCRGLEDTGARRAGVLRKARNGLDVLSERPRRDMKSIRQAVEDVLRSSQKDPLCRPYLLNDIITLAGLAHFNEDLGPEVVNHIREVLEKIASKVGRLCDSLIRVGTGIDRPISESVAAHTKAPMRHGLGAIIAKPAPPI